MIFADKLNYAENKILLVKNLYETSTEEYIQKISEVSDSVNSVMLFGHNPTISETMFALLRMHYEGMATSAAACISFKIDSWKKIFETTGELVFYFSPKDNL